MKKIILMGRSECGKTTLTQALKGDVIHYHKTQYINHYDVVIDTPGEYAENASLAKALALYTYEADVVGLLLSSTEPYSLYPPCVTACCNRPVIGIVTQIDHPDGDPDRAQGWLELAGCHPIFRVSSYTGRGSGRSSTISGSRETSCPGIRNRRRSVPGWFSRINMGGCPRRAADTRKQFRKKQECSCRGRDCGGSFAVMIC